jgi:hypothetical protein
LGTRTGVGGAGTEPREEEPEVSPSERGGVAKERTRGSSIVCRPARAAIRRQLVLTCLTKLWRGVCCWARQGQVREWSGSSGRMANPQAHRPRGAFAGLVGTQSRRRAEEVLSESDRVSGQEVSSVSNQLEAGRHAQECRRAFTRELSKEAGADSKREAKRCTARCRPYNR